MYEMLCPKCEAYKMFCYALDEYFHCPDCKIEAVQTVGELIGETEEVE